MPIHMSINLAVLLIPDLQNSDAGLNSNGLCSYGIHTDGSHSGLSNRLSSYGIYSYGLHSYNLDTAVIYVVMAVQANLQNSTAGVQYSWCIFKSLYQARL